MMKATKTDKLKVIEILSRSFDDNKSVNYILRQDSRREKRLRELMAYSFETCMDFGEVWLNERQPCCALVLFPDRKKFSIKSMFRDLRLICLVTGFLGLFKVLNREKRIKACYKDVAADEENNLYLWFIGTDPVAQGLGFGTEMMTFLLNRADLLQRNVFLETSVERNLSWYQRSGFQRYNQLDLGYTLHFLKN